MCFVTHRNEEYTSKTLRKYDESVTGKTNTNQYQARSMV